MMKDLESDWRAIARLIAAEKEAALADLRRYPLAPLAPLRGAAAPPPTRLRPVLLPVAASLLLAAGLAALWLLRGNWSSAPAAQQGGSDILSESLLYAASGAGEPVFPGTWATGPVSSRFTAWAAAAREISARNDRTSVASSAAAATVERGDPDEVKRRIGRAIQEDAFERLLSHWQEFHEKEA
jgi:hypothetical protein